MGPTFWHIIKNETTFLRSVLYHPQFLLDISCTAEHHQLERPQPPHWFGSDRFELYDLLQPPPPTQGEGEGECVCVCVGGGGYGGGGAGVNYEFLEPHNNDK